MHDRTTRDYSVGQERGSWHVAKVLEGVDSCLKMPSARDQESRTAAWRRLQRHSLVSRRIMTVAPEKPSTSSASPLSVAPPAAVKAAGAATAWPAVPMTEKERADKAWAAMLPEDAGGAKLFYMYEDADAFSWRSLVSCYMQENNGIPPWADEVSAAKPHPHAALVFIVWGRCGGPKAVPVLWKRFSLWVKDRNLLCCPELERRESM